MEHPPVVRGQPRTHRWVVRAQLLLSRSLDWFAVLTDEPELAIDALTLGFTGRPVTREAVELVAVVGGLLLTVGAGEGAHLGLVEAGAADLRRRAHRDPGHLFGFVEEFIAPRMVSLAGDFTLDNREAFDALTNFAAEEVKHMTLFREVRSAVDDTVGVPLELLPGARDVARVVLSKNTGATLLLTAAIEWFTQLHYLTCFKDDASLDPFTQHIFRAHWLEESQHARLDHLETLRAFGRMTEPEKDQAIDDLIGLVGAVDGLLQKQAELDVENLQRVLGRVLGKAEQREILTAVLAAKRYTFIESGVTHPNFQELFALVTTSAQQQKVQQALGAVLAPAA